METDDSEQKDLDPAKRLCCGCVDAPVFILSSLSPFLPRISHPPFAIDLSTTVLDDVSDAGYFARSY